MKPKFDMKGIGDLLFAAVSDGRITTDEYTAAIRGINIVRKLIAKGLPTKKK